MERIKFTSIDKLSTTFQSIKAQSQYVGVDSNDCPIFDESKLLPKMTYRGTVKLHGTCAAISLQGNNLVSLSKERILTPQSDNDGFAAWVESKNKDVWTDIFEKVKSGIKAPVSDSVPITLFGEWCGKGIQKKAAITKCDRMFFIFAVRIGNEVDKGGKSLGWVPLDNFENLKNEEEKIFNSLMFENYTMELNWNHPKAVQALVEEKTRAINDTCPVASYFGTSGVGEGVVWVPVDEEQLNNTRLWFKTKGEKHKQNKKGKDSDIDPVVLKDIESVLDEYLVENRLERGIAYFKEAGIELFPKNTRFFIEFIANDVFKDASEHISALETDEKTIRKAITSHAGKWFNEYLGEMKK